MTEMAGMLTNPQDAVPVQPVGYGETFDLDPGFRAIFDLIRDGAAIGEVVRDPQGRVMNFRFLIQNPAAERLLGTASRNVVGKLGHQLLATEYKLWVEVFDRAVSDRLTKTYRYRFASDPRLWNISVVPFGGDRFAVLYDTVSEEISEA